MLQKSDREELERKLEQTTRLASLTSDQTTLQRLREFADELRQKLQRLISRRRAKRDLEAQIRARARELWEQCGKPTGRDLEFWLQAERELLEDGNDS